MRRSKILWSVLIYIKNEVSREREILSHLQIVHMGGWAELGASLHVMVKRMPGPGENRTPVF
jgi:hypothetical protein